MLGYQFNTKNLTEQVSLMDRARQRRIATAWLAYQGEQKKPLLNKPGQADDNTQVNLARLTVDTTAFYLFGKDLEFEIADDEADTTGNDDTGAETPADVWLENVWKQNKQQTFLLKVGLNGAVCGHVFIKIQPTAGMPYPRLINLDPGCMSVEWMPDDIECVYRYVYEYTANDPIQGRMRNYRQTTEQNGATWVVIDEESDPDSTRWIETGRAVWPHPFPPIIDCQNRPAPNEYWGVSDLETDVQELNAAIDFNLSNTARIIRYHAHPKMVAKGFDGKDLKTGPDQLTVLPTKDSDLWAVEMQSDLTSSQSFYDRLKAAYHEVTQIPEVAVGKMDNVGVLSGLALQILYGPLLQLTNVKRRTYGDMLAELNRRLLALGNFGDANDVETHWPELLSSDPAGEADTLAAHQRMGVVSTETLQRKLGYNPETEAPKIAAEKAASMQQQMAMMQAQPPAQEGTPNG